MTSYLVAAYAIFWAGVFVYVLSLGARQRKLTQQVEVLQTLLESKGQDRDI